MALYECPDPRYIYLGVMTPKTDLWVRVKGNKVDYYGTTTTKSGEYNYVLHGYARRLTADGTEIWNLDQASQIEQCHVVNMAVRSPESVRCLIETNKRIKVLMEGDGLNLEGD